MNSPYAAPAYHPPDKDNDPGSGLDLAFLDKAGEDFVRMASQGSLAIGLWVAGSLIAAATAAALKAFRS